MRERERKIERERERQLDIERETNNSDWTRFDLTRQIETNLYLYTVEAA